MAVLPTLPNQVSMTPNETILEQVLGKLAKYLSTEEIQESIAQFVHDTQCRLTVLEAEVEQESSTQMTTDYQDEWRRILHTVKGNAMTMGAKELADICVEAEINRKWVTSVSEKVLLLRKLTIGLYQYQQLVSQYLSKR